MPTTPISFLTNTIPILANIHISNIIQPSIWKLSQSDIGYPTLSSNLSNCILVFRLVSLGSCFVVVSSCEPSLPILLYSGLEGGVYVDSGIINCSSIFIAIPISLLQTTNYLLTNIPYNYINPS